LFLQAMKQGMERTELRELPLLALLLGASWLRCLVGREEQQEEEKCWMKGKQKERRQ
jgi:hypothetical protein